MIESLLPLLLLIPCPISMAWVSRTTQMPAASTISTTSNILTEPTSKMCLYTDSIRPIVEGSRKNASKRRRILMSSTNDLDEISFDSIDVDERIDSHYGRSLDDLTVSELKEWLRARGLKVSGTKSELLQRMLEAENPHNKSWLQNDGANTNDKDTVDASDVVDNTSHVSELQQLPHPILEAFIKYTSSDSERQPYLLPIQKKSYQHIASGGDAVLFSPTGTGKTLAYILPLAARLFGWKRDGSLVNRKESQKKRFFERSKNDSLSSKQLDPATPSILVVEPSRELARQVGKVWTRFHPTAKSSSKHVATVYGGVPMARHAALLNSKTDVVIGTPGRIRELIREKYLSTENIKSIVLDEADTLLNFKDVPEVEWLLDGMMNDYQLVLASATINKRVENFVGQVMEIEVGEEGYFVIDSSELNPNNAGVHASSTDFGSDEIEVSENRDMESKIHSQVDPSAQPTITIFGHQSGATSPTVRHWSMAASTSSRVALASDLILTISPRRGIIFASSKAEVEKVALELSERLTANDVSIHILHGDMIQAARSRAVAAFRGVVIDSNGHVAQQVADFESSRQTQTQVTRILVATDVASRGLDLPDVDLVLQLGVPRKAGKDGTFDCELYIHRTGRAGRFGSTRAADAILLYDRSLGEGATLSKLQDDIKRVKGVDILPKALPSPREVMDASYERAFRRCKEFKDKNTEDLVQYFKYRLSKDAISDMETDVDKLSSLIDRLACAMAALSGLPQAVHPRSLLTADPKDRTVRVWTESGNLTPPEVTNLVKSLGSGKLGRISICGDGSAVFDLSAKKAEMLLDTAQKDEACQRAGWHFELPDSLPCIPA